MSRRKDAGYSLIELLVVMTLTAMIAVPLVIFSYKGLTSYEFLQAQSNTSTELAILADRMGKVIRGTTGVIDAQANTLTIYGYFSPQDTVVKKVRYFINGTNLNIGVTPPTGTAPNYTYNVADEVVTTTRIDLTMGTNSMFTYYDDSGNVLPNGFSVGQIKAIGLYVAANPRTKQLTVPVAITTRVTLRNFKTNL
ncbi:MAG TPA: prepilin-type N-terminal cleavage/methylation domain-containing protein [Candidatus Saccharimonadia bacterium]|jgi:prepilin-type N-terminal cleavage/methylation domain-containing protein|nr:prepilin-type N-terminal cleavage/methylation domain-containing protein [Candidatus Saccharimonadia bacterium]